MTRVERVREAIGLRSTSSAAAPENQVAVLFGGQDYKRASSARILITVCQRAGNVIRGSGVDWSNHSRFPLTQGLGNQTKLVSCAVSQRIECTFLPSGLSFRAVFGPSGVPPTTRLGWLTHSDLSTDRVRSEIM